MRGGSTETLLRACSTPPYQECLPINEHSVVMTIIHHWSAKDMDSAACNFSSNPPCVSSTPRLHSSGSAADAHYWERRGRTCCATGRIHVDTCPLVYLHGVCSSAEQTSAQSASVACDQSGRRPTGGKVLVGGTSTREVRIKPRRPTRVLVGTPRISASRTRVSRAVAGRTTRRGSVAKVRQYGTYTHTLNIDLTPYPQATRLS